MKEVKKFEEDEVKEIKKVSKKRRYVGLSVLLILLVGIYVLNCVKVYRLPNGSWTFRKPQVVAIMQTNSGQVVAIPVKAVVKKPKVKIPKKSHYEIASGIYVKKVISNGRTIILKLKLNKDKTCEYVMFNTPMKGSWKIIGTKFYVDIDDVPETMVLQYAGNSVIDMKRGTIYIKETKAN